MLTRLSVPTLVQTSALFTAALEDRAHVRDAQELGLLPPAILDPAASGGIPIAPENRHTFYYGCVDFMPYTHAGQTAFAMLELNGTGMGGLTNLPEPVQAAILGELGHAAWALPGADPAPWVLCPLSRPTNRGLIHERVLAGQALAEGLARRFGAARLALCARLDDADPGAPAVILGFPDELRDQLATRDGRLTLAGRPIHGVMRDQFCQHIRDDLGDALQPDSFHAINEIYRVSASKVATYEHYNAFLAAQPRDLPAGPIEFTSAWSRDELVARVRDARAQGRGTVIKPHASGAAKGIEFFFPNSDESAVLPKLDASIAEARERTARAQGPDVPRQVFPYAICTFIDGLTVRDSTHKFAGHRHELRIVVYRHRDRIRSFPALCKVSGQRLDRERPDRRALLNTASVSAGATGQRNDHLLPLCNAGTLAALGIEPTTLAQLCDLAARFTAHVITAHQPPSGCSKQ